MSRSGKSYRQSDQQIHSTNADCQMKRLRTPPFADQATREKKSWPREHYRHDRTRYLRVRLIIGLIPVRVDQHRVDEDPEKGHGDEKNLSQHISADHYTNLTTPPQLICLSHLITLVVVSMRISVRSDARKA